MAILLRRHITDVLKYIQWVADDVPEFPLAVRDAVTSNGDRLREIIEKYKTCTLCNDQTVMDCVSVAQYAKNALTDEYELLIS